MEPSISFSYWPPRAQEAHSPWLQPTHFSKNVIESSEQVSIFLGEPNPQVKGHQQHAVSASVRYLFKRQQCSPPEPRPPTNVVWVSFPKDMAQSVTPFCAMAASRIDSQPGPVGWNGSYRVTHKTTSFSYVSERLENLGFGKK